MQKYNYYRNAGEYPVRPVQPRMGAVTAENARIYANAVEQYEKDMLVYNQSKNAYNKRQSELMAEFEKDLLEEFGLTNHPKASKIFSYVWDKGHAAGFEEVYSEMNSLSELFTD
jgi:hypothetical protein